MNLVSTKNFVDGRSGPVVEVRVVAISRKRDWEHGGRFGATNFTTTEDR